jgi:hypothetical protein
MIDPENVPPVDDQEILARFVLSSRLFRADSTVKPGLFLPFKYVSLSVNRYLDSDARELNEVGKAIAKSRGKSFFGRSEIKALNCRTIQLEVETAPLLDNANHANVIGFPAEKEDQMSLAQKLAASASPLIRPPKNGQA